MNVNEGDRHVMKISDGTEREETRKVSMTKLLLKHWLPSEIPDSNYSVIHRICHLPDLATSDYYLFPKLKEFMKERKFANDKTVICTGNGWLEEKNK